MLYYFNRRKGLSEENPVSIAFEQHNHDACLNKAMLNAEEHCHERKLKLTPARRKVLELLLQEHRV
jgi:Fur family zinc uptake transcriptional regulator